MLIDIHVHAKQTRHPITTGPEGKTFPVPHELISMMDKYGIDMAVLLPSMTPDWHWMYITPEETLEMCALYPKRLIPFCSLDSRMVKNSPKSNFLPLLRYYKEAGCKGVGEFMTNLPFDHPIQMNFFKQVEETGLPLIFHIGPRRGGCYGCYDELGLPRLEKVLKACPKLTMLGHSQPFWAEIGADATRQSRAGYPKGKVKPGRLVHLMRKYPNLHGDLSAGSGQNALSRDPEFGYRFLEEFQDKLYFGTDICHDGQDLPQPDYFRTLKKERRISPAAYEKITWRNANRLLNLGLKKPWIAKRHPHRGNEAAF